MVAWSVMRGTGLRNGCLERDAWNRTKEWLLGA